MTGIKALARVKSLCFSVAKDSQRFLFTVFNHESSLSPSYSLYNGRINSHLARYEAGWMFLGKSIFIDLWIYELRGAQGRRVDSPIDSRAGRKIDGRGYSMKGELSNHI